MKVATSSTSASTHWAQPLEDVLFDFAGMVGAKEFSDCRVQSDDGSIRSHKIILAMRCPLFADAWGVTAEGKLSKKNKKNKDAVFDCSTFPQKYVGELVRYCYADMVR